MCHSLSQLPESLSALTYSNILCGVVRGALEMVRSGRPQTPTSSILENTLSQVQYKVECHFLTDTLKGDEVSEVRALIMCNNRSAPCRFLDYAYARRRCLCS